MSGAHRAAAAHRAFGTAPRPSGLLTWLAAAVGVLAAVAALCSVRTMDVLTGSMRPHVPPGSLVVTTGVDVDQVRVGDVIAFRPPAGYAEAGGRPVLHRVVEVTPDGSLRRIRTRGDANARPDPWTLELQGRRVAVERLHLPLLGWLLAAGRQEAGYLGLGVACAVAAAGLLRRRVTRDACSCPPAGRSRPAPSFVQLPKEWEHLFTS